MNFSRPHFKFLFTTIFFSFFFFLFSFSQSDSIFKNTIDTLKALSKIIQRGENDSARNSANTIFNSQLENFLSIENSFYRNFDSLNTLSVQTAPDNSFRLFTWMQPKYDGSRYFYFGFLQTKNLKTKQIQLFSLRDSSELIEKPQSEKLKPEKWYGALYYKIILSKKDKKNYYVLLGWHARNEQVKQKLIDVISFENGKPVFGAALFKSGNVYNRRVVFEFYSRSSMTLRYEESKNMIVFDHLSKNNSSPIGGPDGTYDAYKYSNGRWQLIKDIDVDANFHPKVQKEKPKSDEELEEMKK
jgi:hypothetical protein